MSQVNLSRTSTFAVPPEGRLGIGIDSNGAAVIVDENGVATPLIGTPAENVASINIVANRGVDTASNVPATFVEGDIYVTNDSFQVLIAVDDVTWSVTDLIEGQFVTDSNVADYVVYQFAGGILVIPLTELPPGIQGDIVYHNGTTWVVLNASDDGKVLTTHGVGQNPTYENAPAPPPPTLPSLRGDDWTQADVVAYLTSRHIENGDCGTPIISQTPNTYTIPAGPAYGGGVYDAIKNRIYLVPYGQSNQTNWHYIDCSDGSIVEYTHGATAVQYAYFGGVYSPTQNRIYFVPRGQSNQTNWHYIDCSDGSIGSYTHAPAEVVVNAYSGGVYSPTQNRIYFVPYGTADVVTWHYIDCSTGNVIQYTHSATVTHDGYYGGVYSPTQNRIYFSPSRQGTQLSWHYIDCSDGSIVSYLHGTSAGDYAYQGGVYSPTQNRIYFVPNQRANDTTWHYIDCSDGSIVEYTHGITAVNSAYSGGVYSPTQNRIYLVPSAQSTSSSWHYIDCSDGSVVSYPKGSITVGSLSGGVYSPTQNRIYFVPQNNATESIWYGILMTSQASISPRLAAHAVFNKY